MMLLHQCEMMLRVLYARQQFNNISRQIYSLTGIWENDFTVATRRQVETSWQKWLQEYNETLTINEKNMKSKYYVLSMFPYPSGKLHMGHVRVYTISDTLAHFHRMNGKQVLHPMGWDGFGLPAENAAIERNLRPDDWTFSNIDHMRDQLKSLSMCFNWERELTTCKPEYYRWTQSIFLRLFHAGLAYQKEAAVNWDPVDQTVLANEQVDDSGCSWRSGVKVEQKILKQWYLKMSHYSKSLLDGLDDLTEWPESIRSMQANWIGNCSGCSFNFTLQVCGDEVSIPVHLSNPEFVFGVAYILIAPSHMLFKSDTFLQSIKPEVQELLDKMDSGQIDIPLSVSAIHPFTKQLVLLIATSKHSFADYVELYAGVPAVVAEDKMFADDHGISYKQVVNTDGLMINSNEFSGMKPDEAKEAIMKSARQSDLGGHMTSSRQFDWLISRQRYWGTPIPIIHCKKCKAVPVPRDDLPVELPELETKGKGTSLKQVCEWYNVRCPKCGQPAHRETDTMDTFVDSSWYFLRHTDVHNEEKEFDSAIANTLMPVDLYIGGKEHAIMHLLYARFISHFLHSEGLLQHKEPFQHLLVQGLVMGQTYRLASTGQYLCKDQVDFTGKEPVEKGTGEKLSVKIEKMSKSKYNGVDPVESIAEYGIDTVRLFILSGVPPHLNMVWNVNEIVGITRWKTKMWQLVTRFIDLRKASSGVIRNQDIEKKLVLEKNIAIKEVTKQYTEDHLLSVAISRLMTLTNVLRDVPDATVSSIEYEDALASLCIMLSPMAPHIASEMWQGLAITANPSSKFSWDKSVLHQNWPVTDVQCVAEKELIKVIIKINNQTKGHVTIPANLRHDEEEIRRLVVDSELGESHLKEKIVKRVVFVSKVPLLNYIIENNKKL